MKYLDIKVGLAIWREISQIFTILNFVKLYLGIKIVLALRHGINFQNSIVDYQSDWKSAVDDEIAINDERQKFFEIMQYRIGVSLSRRCQNRKLRVKFSKNWLLSCKVLNKRGAITKEMALRFEMAFGKPNAAHDYKTLLIFGKPDNVLLRFR